MEIIEFRKGLEKAIKGMRQYRKYDICNLIVSKVFNNGCGCIELFRFYIVEKKIAINKTMFNKRDKDCISSRQQKYIDGLIGFKIKPYLAQNLSLKTRLKTQS